MQGVRGGGHLPAPAPEKTCKDCGGSSICPHQRITSRCKDCGGSSIPQGVAAPTEPAGAQWPRLLKLAEETTTTMMGSQATSAPFRLLRRAALLLALSGASGGAMIDSSSSPSVLCRREPLARMPLKRRRTGDRWAGQTQREKGISADIGCYVYRLAP
jgi:hypothetical protein